ncbi:MAG: DUF3570 domain-containing protein [Rubrivivax sp.]|nr:DUF3570 domain-containing protein [Rubrivivax sp.]
MLSSLMAGSAATQAGAATLPPDKAEVIYHVYDGGGVKADGPALLVRKSLMDRVSLSAQYYVDAVSNASIDVVTTASPFKETRSAWNFSADTVVRDSIISVGYSKSTEPDYIAEALNVDVAHEVFGGMTTVSMGFTRAKDLVGQKNTPGWIDSASHWQYRTGLTQILTPTWLMSANFEVVSDSGFLGSPYRAARVFGATEKERNPRTRSSRAVKLRSINDTGALVARSSLRAEYRYFWDTWDIKAQTFEIGGSNYLGQSFLLDVSVRSYSQSKALFYSDNAAVVNQFNSRNRQLSPFKSTGLSAKLTWTPPAWRAGWDTQITGVLERKQFRFSDFTDLRTGGLYSYNANVVQVYLSSTF